MKSLKQLILATIFALYAASCGGSSGGGNGITPTSIPPNNPPTASAGIYSVDPSNQYHPSYAHLGNNITLEGIASDPDNDPINYSWRFTYLPVTTSLTNDSIVNRYTAYPSFVQDKLGDYCLELKVDDGKDSNTDVVCISAQNNTAPVADAGNDTYGAIAGISAVSLNGSNSSDSHGAIVLCEWDYENDGTYDWSSTSTCSTTHIYPSPGNITAKLRVIDDDNSQHTDTKFVEVN